MTTRVRFAPSPTGYLHIGGLRTALYNFLVARHAGGQLLLRIEDTDQSRFVADAEGDILRALKWAGLEPDEGVDRGGPFGPYRQSERTTHYADVARQLIEAGNAYVAFDTPEELDALRSRVAAEGQMPSKYSAAIRLQMRNSLSIGEEETQRLIASGAPHVVRLKVPEGEEISFVDLIRGQVTFRNEEVDDQILVKSDGMPTYHLANVVDDHLMCISHVIRGEEWLSSTPKHVLLYRFLGWDEPQMAHLPLILSPTGGKLSKRNADSQGIPVLVRDYIAAGYEPEALLNYLAFLGWNPGTDEELFNLDDLVEAFTLDRVGSSGVQFSMDKLRWYNERHLRQMDPAELGKRVERHMAERGVVTSPEYLAEVLNLMAERISFASDVAAAEYFFRDPASYDEQGIKKRWKEDSPSLLAEYATRLERTQTFDAQSAESTLRALAEEQDVGAGRIIHPTRLALSGVTYGPGLFEMMELLGRATCVARIRAAVARLS